jgi:hypothetical protein
VVVCKLGEAKEMGSSLLLASASFTTVRLTEDYPIAMLSPRMMRGLPFGIDDWPFAYLDNAVASRKADVLSGSDEVKVSPLIAVVMYIVSYFTKEYAIVDEYTPSFGHERWIRVGEAVSIFFGRTGTKPEACVEVF